MKKVKIDQLRNIIEENKKAFVVFSTEWCGECKMYKTAIEMFIKEFGDNFSDINIVNIDVDEEWLWPEEKNEFKPLIMKVPTTMLFNDGINKKVIEGFLSKNSIKEILEKEF